MKLSCPIIPDKNASPPTMMRCDDEDVEQQQEESHNDLERAECERRKRLGHSSSMRKLKAGMKSLSSRNITSNETDHNDYSAELSRSKKCIREQKMEELLLELENIDEDGHFLDGHEHVIPFYAPPVQRRRWDQDTMLPHINWGDLFFDLFYVACASNLGVMLTSAMNDEHQLRGIIYYIGIFGPLWISWETPMFYASKYTTLDYFHRLFEMFRYFCASNAIMRISPIDLMADPKSSNTLVFTLAVFLESLTHLVLNCELYFRGQGDRASIKSYSWGNIKYQLPVSLTYLSALIVSAILYIQPGGQDASRLVTSTDTGENASMSTWELSDLPLTLTAIAYFLHITLFAFRMVYLSKVRDIKQFYVPSNVDYMTHRYGEWIILMIGEGILSLLIVETIDSRVYFLVTTFGVLTMIFIQVLKFESEPSHAEGHALWKNLLNGMCYSYLIQFLSIGLIVFGVTYKVFLIWVLKTEEENKKVDPEGHRMLASSTNVSSKSAAAVFVVALVVVLLSLELMNLTHSGAKEALTSLLRKVDGRTLPHWPLIVTSILKVAIIIFAMTLNQWTVEPEVLTICGCGIFWAMACTRVINFFFTHGKGVIERKAESLCKAVRNSVVKHGIERGAGKFARRKSYDTDSQVDASTSSKHSSTSHAESDGDLASKSFDGIIVANLNGIIVKVNDTAVRLFGYASDKEMIGKNISILCGGGDSKRHDGYIKAFRRKVNLGAASGKHSKVLGQQRMIHGCRADGTEFPCVIGVKLVQKNTKVVGFIRDMTDFVSADKERASNAMKIENAMNRVVDDHAFDAVVVFDDQGVIKRVNSRAVVEFGYESKAEFVGNISVLIQGAIDDISVLLASHGEQRVLMLSKKDGDEFLCIVATTAIKGTALIAAYIRNLNEVMSEIKCRGSWDEETSIAIRKRGCIGPDL